jgi:hypothetical protein
MLADHDPYQYEQQDADCAGHQCGGGGEQVSFP